jgi:hypothetical protein
MKSKFKERIDAEISATKFFDEFPAEISGYNLKKILSEDGDKFFYFTYENEKIHRNFTAYFHEETSEYKVRVKIGLTEFCLTKFFTNKFENFAEILKNEMQIAIENLSAPANIETDLLIAEKNFGAWEYPKTLPENLEGFELFITPEKPVKITNGSYIILNYSNFEINGDLTIYYNVYTDNFSGESKINLVPNVSYLFDADNLKDLESKLQKNLSAELINIKKFSE